ncbi:hypothetical protein J8J07_22165, partial [Mycobacterium tuberculosis]|nr:hypothetical protein [Mycobacterium tuberculosis]
VLQFYRYYNPVAAVPGFMNVSANGVIATRKPGRTGRPARIELVLDPATGVAVPRSVVRGGRAADLARAVHGAAVTASAALDPVTPGG